MAFDPERDIPDLAGKVILVTGGNRGLGAATVKFLVPHKPAAVFICATPSSLSNAEDFVSSVKSSHPDANIEIIPMNLSSFDSVRNCAAEFNKKTDRLDILFLNAGVSTTAPALTQEGYESQFGINFLGHALLTQLLLPTLLRTAATQKQGSVRIMVTASMAARLNPPDGGLALDQMKTADALSSPYQRYAHSKVAKILFARKLAQIYPSIVSVAFDPGQVYTDLFSKATGLNPFIRRLIVPPFAWLTGVSADKGAENGLWAATAEDVRSGAYYEPVGKLADGVQHFSDQVLTNTLWEWTDRELRSNGALGWSTE